MGFVPSLRRVAMVTIVAVLAFVLGVGFVATLAPALLPDLVRDVLVELSGVWLAGARTVTSAQAGVFASVAVTSVAACLAAWLCVRKFRASKCTSGDGLKAKAA